MTDRARLFAFCSAVASTIAVALAVALIVAPSGRVGVVSAALCLAVASGAVVSVADAILLLGSRARPAGREEPSGSTSCERSPVTFVMSLGEERPDIARTSIVLAAQAGPVHVVATRHHDLIDDLADTDVTEHVAATIQEAILDAAAAVTTDAVLLLSASAFPVAEQSERGAAKLVEGVGWVTGTAPTFNQDRYAPKERELLGSRVRSAARQLGLHTWEPDATIVRTSLLREHPLDPTRPYGRWLRARAAEGWEGRAYPAPVAVQAAPADAPVFWPARTSRQRGVVADLADAAATGRLRQRALAAALLVRELLAVPMLCWLLAIVLIGRSGNFPLRVAPPAFFAIVALLSGGRWVSSRMAYGIGLHPVDEARAAAYDLPGSLLAIPSAVTRRVRRARLTLPDQPLLWAAILLTLLTTAPLVDRRAPTNSAIGVSVGLALGALGASWVFAMRAFGARGWDRASYRLALDLPATVDGEPARTLDASPSGLALTGVDERLARGQRISLTIAFDDGVVMPLRGVVTDRRASAGQASVGVALDLEDEERSSWIRHLFDAAGVTGGEPVVHHEAGSHGSSRPRWSRRSRCSSAARSCSRSSATGPWSSVPARWCRGCASATS